MKIVPVDYNATIPDGGLHLGFPDTRRALQEQGVGPGDAIWASDGEVLVGAVLAIDPIDGLVAVPHWETIVHLDDYTPADFPSALEDLVKRLKRSDRGEEEAAPVFQLATVVDHLAPRGWADLRQPGYLALRRAGSLYVLRELELTLLALSEARQERPDDPGQIDFFSLLVLQQLRPAQARLEAERRAASTDANAGTLAASINIVAGAADEATDQEFARLGPQILDWFERFQHASKRDQVLASILALVQFNLGLILLRLGRADEAREALRTAHAIDPTEPTIDEAQKLSIFDTTARELAARYRAKAMVVAA